MDYVTRVAHTLNKDETSRFNDKAIVSPCIPAVEGDGRRSSRGRQPQVTGEKGESARRLFRDDQGHRDPRHDDRSELQGVHASREIFEE